MVVCPACGQENPEVARFCLACGFSIGEAIPPPRDERRIVTVIFVDLVGFTARAERLDPEEVRAVLAPYHDRVRREIESFGGVVEKFIGDAVMGVFGAPVAHGDDAERAVRAALVVRDIVGELAGGDLQIRIAVNTGEAVVSLGARPAFGESMVAGDVVNTAARLQAAAPVNGVVVGEETYLTTRNAIEYAQADPVIAKGKEQPVEAWLAVRAITAAGQRPVSNLSIVGRTFEIAILNALWERASAEQLPHLVSVFGPAGVGKTTLAAEFGRRAAEQGARVVQGRSLPYRESGTYGALAAQVMKLAGVYESDPAEVVAEKLHSSANGAARRNGSRPGRGQRAPRRARRRRGGRRGLRPRGALLLGPGVHRSGRPRAADDPHLRGRPLGRRQPARPDPRARNRSARAAAPVRDARAPGAARPAGRLGLRLDRLHGADARRARRAARPGADRPQTRERRSGGSR